jgi:metal-dependent hydrolase (beta-lactamase superfamily II)
MANPQNVVRGEREVKVTIIYDNEVKKKELRAGWGFSAFIENKGVPPTLFDTGADSPTLLHNMKELGINPKDIGIIVVTGCSHPAMRNILGAASKFGKVYGIAGGFHGFHDFKIFENLSLIYPCHCTQYKKQILDLFPDKASECGAGLLIEL